MNAQTRAEISDWRFIVRVLTDSRDIYPDDRKRVRLHNKCIKIAQQQIKELEAQ